MVRFSDTLETTLAPSETKHFVEYETLIPKLVIEERSAQAQRAKAAAAQDEIEDIKDKHASETNSESGGEGEQDNPELEIAHEFYQEMHSSFRSLEILGQILRNRFGSFERDKLKSLADEGIKVGLRVINVHLRLSADNKAVIIETIRELMTAGCVSSWPLLPPEQPGLRPVTFQSSSAMGATRFSRASLVSTGRAATSLE
jgi:hypothetical protein